jgi:hypothetical protein
MLIEVYLSSNYSPEKGQVKIIESHEFTDLKEGRKIKKEMIKKYNMKSHYGQYLGDQGYELSTGGWV